LSYLERLPRPLLALGVPLVFFAIAFWVMPIADTLQFDPDEGIELAKATLYSQGYRLYDQIWNDQPPLLTVLLSGWLKIFGSQIVAVRLLILGFATILVGAFFNTLLLILGVGPALLGTIGLCLTLDFLRLSVSVMQGLPALAFVMLAVYLLVGIAQPSQWVTKARNAAACDARLPWTSFGAIASGVCFGLSLQIKLYTALLLPACLLQIGLGSSFQDWKPLRKGRLWLSFVWLGSCALTVVAIGLLTHSFHLDQLLGTHFEGDAQVLLQREPSWQILLMFLAQDLDYFLLANVGLWVLLRRLNRWPILPLVWLVSVLVGLSFYQPLWYHYYPLVSIPVAWLAAYGATQSLSFFQQKRWGRFVRWSFLKHPTLRGTTATFVGFAIVLTPVKLAVNAVINHKFVEESQQKLEVVQQVRAFRSSTHWLFTDLPIVAFYANLNVPPELAVFSTKRIASGSLSDAALTRILQTYHPEQVLLGRYPKVQAALKPYLSQHYVKQFEKDKVTQYVLKSSMRKSSMR
jgi:4-amino-4-deoxy-L-arabinose transferase-like glycosyltransferase